jgi:ABC-type transporter Mla MlaB component
MPGELSIDCGEVVDISTVNELYQQLNGVLEQDGPVNLNAGAIERIDTAALQMFVCFIQEVKRRHREVHWQTPSEALLRSANYLGLKQVLQLNGNN